MAPARSTQPPIYALNAEFFRALGHPVRIRLLQLLRGELQLVDGAGHMPWLDDPSAVAGHVSRFLAT